MYVRFDRSAGIADLFFLDSQLVHYYGCADGYLRL
jgi:hypothetical protein